MSFVSESRFLKCGIVVLMGMVLTACDGQGFSGVQAEWSRVRAKGQFVFISASHERAVVSAKGRQVAIEPADGFCVAKESIETSGRSAFVLIGDCALDAETEKRSARGELQLPRGVPGFMTVSVSGSSAVPIDGSQDATLNNLSEFFDTPEGRRLLGRGGDGENVDVVESRRIGDGLFVLVDDKDEQPVPLLSPRFWRSFVQLNDRLAVVTMSGFKDRPLSEDDMLEHLIAQVKRLRVANRVPINEEPTLLVQRGDDSRRTASTITTLQPAPDSQRISDLKPTAVIVTAERTGEKELWPLPAAKTEQPNGQGGPTVETERKAAALLDSDAKIPRARPEQESAETTAETATVKLTNPSDVTQSRTTVANEEVETGTQNAPRSAPSAPRRPKRV